MGVKGAWKKFDKFTDMSPKSQLKFWYSFYKPITVSLFWALFPALAVAALMHWAGKYSDFEIEVITLMTFISVRVNNVYTAINNLKAKP